MGNVTVAERCANSRDALQVVPFHSV
jgi:hypothetical protein